jgi:hypothetical protein
VQYDKKSFFENAYAYKNAQFDTDFESAEKDAKHASKKVINEKVREKWSFFFYYCVQNCSVSNFLGVNFLTFFKRIRTQHRILRFKIPISNFCKTKYIFLKVALFAKCKVKRGRNKAKKLKTYFINVSYSYTIYGLGGSILSKKSLLFCPKVIVQCKLRSKNQILFPHIRKSEKFVTLYSLNVNVCVRTVHVHNYSYA